MLFCDTCGDSRLWPHSYSQVYSQCEVCGICSACSDIPAGVLPIPSSVGVAAGEEHGKRSRSGVATQER